VLAESGVPHWQDRFSEMHPGTALSNGQARRFRRGGRHEEWPLRSAPWRANRNRRQVGHWLTELVRNDDRDARNNLDEAAESVTPRQGHRIAAAAEAWLATFPDALRRTPRANAGARPYRSAARLSAEMPVRNAACRSGSASFADLGRRPGERKWPSLMVALCQRHRALINIAARSPSDHRHFRDGVLYRNARKRLP
jgi:hypothetical protein